MQTRVFALIVASLFLSDGSWADENPKPRKLYEKEGGFSYDPPKGWQTAKASQFPYHIAIGPAENGTNAHILVVRRYAKDISPKQYAKTHLGGFKKMKENVTVAVDEEFKTSDGEAGVRQVVAFVANDKKLRATFFYLKHGDYLFFVTCNGIPKDPKKFDQTLAQSLKSFRLHPIVKDRK